MECPRCKKRIKRLRTLDKGSTVIRYNRCTKCGERVKSIEVYLIEYDRSRIDTLSRASEAESESRQLTLSIDAIKTAFRHLHDAVLPLEEAKEWPTMRRNTRLKCVSDWKPTS